MSDLIPRAEALARQLHAGQTWTPKRAGSRAKPRTIVWVGDMPETMPKWLQAYRNTVGWAHDVAKPAFPSSGHDSWLNAGQFRAWITKHEAVVSQSDE